MAKEGKIYLHEGESSIGTATKGILPPSQKGM
jgi:hypothetical protein